MRLLLVEDDSIILRGLKNGINWNAIEGIESVDTAVDGELALEKMQAEAADIVVTDINMPIMDGLALTKEIRSRWPETVIIILTGYNTFSYAQQALKLGVFDYLMKPVRAKELQACVTRAIEHLIKTRQEKRQLKATLPLLQIQFLTHLVQGKEHNPEQQLASLELPPLETPLQLAIIRFDKARSNFTEEEERRFIGEEAVQEALLGWQWEMDDAHYVILGHAPMEDKLLALLRQRSDWTISMSAEFDGLLDASEAYQDTLHRLETYGVLYQGQLLTPSNIEGLHATGTIQDLADNLFRAVNQGERDAVKSTIESLRSITPKETEKTYCLQLLFRLGETSTHLSSQQVLDSSLIHYDKAIESVMASQDPYATVASVALTICDAIHTPRNADPLNQKMIQFIKNHYTESSLSLKSLGDYMDMAPAYLSSLFKEKNGISFSDYISELRMEKARALLISTNKKTYEIAQSVGISNPQYFSARFKQLFGETPTDYRSRR